MKFNQTSLKGRMFVLVGVMLLAQVILIGVGVQKAGVLLSTLNHVTNQQVPAERDLLNIDMIHDEVHSVVLEAFHAETSGDRAALLDTQKNLNQTTEDFKRHIKSLQSLKLSPVTLQKAREADSEFSEYLDKGKLVIDGLVNNQGRKANTDYAVFLSQFKKLEKDLAQFRDDVARDTQSSGDQGKDIVLYLILTSIFGFIVSGIAAFFILGWTKKSFDGILGKISGTANLISKSAFSVTRESTKVKDSAVEQSAAIQESVSALSEMSSMISQTGQNVRISMDTASMAHDKSSEGKKIMEHLSHAMTSIQKANSSLQDISKVIENIVNKTAVINDIVFKTQLLSFNASIEAARAGVHGRGFAVVAEEVGNLAELSGAAAKEIEHLLVESQRRVRDTLEVIQDRVGDGYKVSQNAHQVFEEISKNIEQINVQIKSIGEATQQQEIGVQQANTAMRQMDESSQTNTDAAMVAQSTAEQLRKDTTTLYNVFEELTLLVNGSKIRQRNGRQKNDSLLPMNQHDESEGHVDPEMENLVTHIASKQNDWAGSDANAASQGSEPVDRTQFKKVVG